MISRSMARRISRGVTLVQVVVVVSLVSILVAGMTMALYGQLGPLFGEADNTLSGVQKDPAANDNTQNQITGHSADADPNAIGNSLQQNARDNTKAAAKAKGTP